MDLVKEKKEFPFIAGFLVVREKSSIQSIWQLDYVPTGVPGSQESSQRTVKMEKQSSARLWLNQQPSWKASCHNLCSELPWPMQVSLGMTQCRHAVTTPVSQAFWFRGSETTFTPLHYMKHIKQEIKPFQLTWTQPLWPTEDRKHFQETTHSHIRAECPLKLCL